MAKRHTSAGTPRGSKSFEQLGQLETIGDIRRYLANLIHRVERGRITVKKANCCTQIANTLIGAIADHELERRITELENQRAAGRLPYQNQMTIRAEGSA